MKSLVATTLLLLYALSAYSVVSQSTLGAAENEPSGAAQPSSPGASIPGGAVPAPVHPMAAYLSLRPMLPTKSAFFPPMVDPNAYVDRKAWILSNLFGAPVPSAAGAAPSPVYPFFGPAYFTAKKNSFLNSLFAGQQPLSPMYTGGGASGQARRALPPSAGFPFAPGAFAAKKTAFLQKLFETLNATATPPAATTQPSWMDLLDTESQPQTNLPRVPLSPPASPVDPTYYANKKTEFLSQLFDSIGLPPPPSVIARPTVVPPNFWSPFSTNSALGGPYTKPTIVPPGFWTPSSIPTPGAIYKQKVADFLGKLFQQLNATTNKTSPETEKRNVPGDETEVDGTKHESSISRRGIAGPFGGSFGFGKPFAASPVDPQFFADKKSAFLSKLIASKGASGAGDGSGESSISSSWGSFGGFYPTPKPTIVPPDFWNPFPAGKVNPITSPIFSPFVPTVVKPTIVPPDFWSPFAGLKQKNNAVSSPSGTVVNPKVQRLDTLFEGGKNSCPYCAEEDSTSMSQQPQLAQQSLHTLQLQSQDPASDEDSLWDTFLRELAEALSAPVHRSSRSVSPEVARQQLQDSTMTQLSAIKDDMLNTVNSILKQKAEASAAAAAPPFPFGKSAYAAYGAMKKGGGGGSGAAGKKGGPPGKGGFPFWGGPPSAPTPDPTEPLQQRLLVLNNAFDSLATLQKDASAALQAVSTPDAPIPYAYPIPAPNPSGMDTATLLQMIRAAATSSDGGKAARKAKSGKAAPRSIQFAVRQGQLSLPAGAEELLTAGGGASPDQHEGGGLRLQIKVPAVTQV